MRKCRIKKNFWFNDEEDNLLKQLSEFSGKTQTQVIKKLLKGATIKEKPPQEFYKNINELVSLKRELKKVRDLARFTQELDVNKLQKYLDEIDELRARITENYLK